MRKLSVNTGITSSRLNKQTPQAKRVTPPAVPDIYRFSGSSFGSAGYSSSEDGVFTQLPDTPSDMINSSDNESMTRVNAVSLSNQTSYPFSVASREPLTHKVAVYYHQQLALQEDQGIDLTQSPGRDSPGSSSGSAGSGSRHSTASLDSGRASSYLTGGTRGTLSSPRCSVSSCSIGSVDRMSQKSQDHEIILDWLMELHFEDYSQLFSSAGYDLATITRMTPEDLTAIGIKNPSHREKIKQHIDNLQLPDNLPNYVPGSIEEWLRLLRLEEYLQPLLIQGYQSVKDVTQIIWEDLEDIGIVKLGHQKKILLAIKRIKDIISRKFVPSTNNTSQQQQKNIPSNYKNTSYIQQQYKNPVHYQQQQLPQQSNNQQLLMSTTVSPGWNQFLSNPSTCNSSNSTEHDIVLIELRQPQGKSLESLEDTNGTHLTFSRPAEMSCHQLQLHNVHYQPCSNIVQLNNRQYFGANTSTIPWRRSYEDGDITPTNEIAMCSSESLQSGGTLPRHRSNNASMQMTRLRPIAKVQANISVVQLNEHTPQQQNDYDQMNLKCSVPAFQNSPLMCKKKPPEPPRRQCSTTKFEKINSNFDVLNLSHPIIYHQNNYKQNQPFYSNFSGHTHQTMAEVHAEICNDSKSNSSIDSIDVLPFANENSGTIKQRTLNRPDITSISSSSSSSSSSSTITIATVGHQTNNNNSNNKNVTLSSSIGMTSSKNSTSTCDEDAFSSTINDNKKLLSCNVLNDIGHMLANLTDELDAMLEEEKQSAFNQGE